ncbi:DNA-binding response regulator [Arenimonas soli]|uniref:DNA-binding response regulator n=1 Tax=Arenimonas soli TaxID=2269504 RepID=A0ABQ1HHY1_9GAMM|nr:DNA-binding response regulator [Arenimonas soli]
MAAGIGDYLEANGLRVDYAANAFEARAQVARACFDVLVLDVNLPGQDGIGLCRDLKQAQGLGTPAIFLTARGALQDKLEGFAAGAIDYMVKPFAPVELLVRIRAICARVASQSPVCVDVAGYTLDLHSGLLSHAGRSLQLHSAGLAILGRLMQAHPRSVSKQALREDLWGDQSPQSDPLRAHVYQLRQAMLERFGEAPISTVRGIGYRFGAEP